MSLAGSVAGRVDQPRPVARPAAAARNRGEPTTTIRYRSTGSLTRPRLAARRRRRRGRGRAPRRRAGSAAARASPWPSPRPRTCRTRPAHRWLNAVDQGRRQELGDGAGDQQSHVCRRALRGPDRGLRLGAERHHLGGDAEQPAAALGEGHRVALRGRAAGRPGAAAARPARGETAGSLTPEDVCRRPHRSEPRDQHKRAELREGHAPTIPLGGRRRQPRERPINHSVIGPLPTCPPAAQDDRRSPLARSGTTLRISEASMQVPAHFEYERATSVDHALALLARWGAEARVVAGGHSLIPMMKLRLARPGGADRHQRPGRAGVPPALRRPVARSAR